MTEAYHVKTREQDDGSYIAYLVEQPEIYAYAWTANEAVSLLFLSLAEPVEQMEVSA